jgi:2-iminobutanoate/2-iminopropanoate deaminase
MTQILKLGKVLIAAMVAAWVRGFATPAVAVDTGEVGRDVREQTRNALERIKRILEAVGTSLENVLTATTHLTKREDLAAYNEEYAKYFPADKPARTTVEVTLNSPELLVEITVTAGIPD